MVLLGLNFPFFFFEILGSKSRLFKIWVTKIEASPNFMPQKYNLLLFILIVRLSNLVFFFLGVIWIGGCVGYDNGVCEGCKWWEVSLCYIPQAFTCYCKLGQFLRFLFFMLLLFVTSLSDVDGHFCCRFTPRCQLISL